MSTKNWAKEYYKSSAVLPDGIFSSQKSPFGQFLEGLTMEHVGIFLPFCQF
jgi:hypothetical protein